MEESDKSERGSDFDDDFFMDEFDDDNPEISDLNIKLSRDLLNKCKNKARYSSIQANIFKVCNIVTSLTMAAFGIAVTILSTGFIPGLGIAILVGMGTFINLARDILKIGNNWC